MFTDTHFHFNHLDELGINCPELLENLVASDFGFLQDIGTRCDDLKERIEKYEKAVSLIDDENTRNRINQIYYFSAGIWPDQNAILDRFNQIKILEKNIAECEKKDRIVAIGECGLDHHWNVNGTDPRTEEQFNDEVLKGEEEMFEMQLELARKMNKPVIIHSRDAFEGTLSCIKNVGYHNGGIHCFSYGKEEAKAFLDLGWYIAFGGAVTYTKKTKLEEMKELLRYVPKDMLLLETDSPYLAPVPHRGKTNTPLLVLSTYGFIAEILGISVEELGNISMENAKKLFL